MKRLLLAALAASALSLHAQDVQLTLHPQDAKNVIPAEIYGQFAEHLGSCIYGGIWVGKDSPIPNTEGYRNDVLQALKDLEIPVLRWPGGCFADEYHWMDGIGPQENRPRLVNNNWGGTVEDNSFGTHEFLNLCEMLGCEPYVSGNVGSGSVEEMAKWIEYMTSDTNSTMAELRRKNGRDKPWKVKYFGVGNESWGCGGNMTPEYYVNEYRRYAIYARDYGKNRLFRIASGANATDNHWTEVCMKQIGPGRMKGLSVHYYAVRNWDEGKKGSATDFTAQNYYETLSKAMGIEKCVVDHMKIMDKYDPKKKVAFMVDEWGTWWEVEPGTNPGHLFQQNTMRDAIVASTSLDIFQKYTDRIKMTNIAQVVNVLQAMVLTRGDQMLLTPTYYVFTMYKPHKLGTFIPADLTCEQITVNDKESVPQVSSTQSVKDGVITLSLTNTDLSHEHTVAVNVDGMQIKGAEGTIINARNISDYNEFGKAEKIHPEVFKGTQVKKGQLLVTLPAHSIVTLTLK